jgi:hypothetical protein
LAEIRSAPWRDLRDKVLERMPARSETTLRRKATSTVTAGHAAQVAVCGTVGHRVDAGLGRDEEQVTRTYRLGVRPDPRPGGRAM